MSGSSGWMAQENYDRMEAVALAKKPENREPWEVNYLNSLEDMRQAEIADRSPVVFRIFQLFMFYILIVSVVGVIKVLTLIV